MSTIWPAMLGLFHLTLEEQQVGTNYLSRKTSKTDQVNNPSRLNSLRAVIWSLSELCSEASLG